MFEVVLRFIYTFKILKPRFFVGSAILTSHFTQAIRLFPNIFFYIRAIIQIHFKVWLLFEERKLNIFQMKNEANDLYGQLHLSLETKLK